MWTVRSLLIPVFLSPACSLRHTPITALPTMRRGWPEISRDSALVRESSPDSCVCVCVYIDIRVPLNGGRCGRRNWARIVGRVGAENLTPVPFHSDHCQVAAGAPTRSRRAALGVAPRSCCRKDQSPGWTGAHYPMQIILSAIRDKIADPQMREQSACRRGVDWHTKYDEFVASSTADGPRTAGGCR